MSKRLLNYLSKIGLLIAVYLIFYHLFFFFNYQSFSTIGFANYWYLMFASLRFSLSAIAFTNIIFAILLFFPYSLNFKLKDKLINGLFIIINAVAFAFNAIDLVYYRFNGKRTGSELFLANGMGDDVVRLIPSFIKDYWYIILIYILIITVFIKAHNYINKKTQEDYKAGIIIKIAVWFLLLGLNILAFRGGTQLRPIKPITAGLYAEPQYIPMVLNTPFCIIRSAESVSLEPKKYFNDSNELTKVFNPIKKYNSSPISDKANVVIIILESFSNEYIGFFNNGYSYTPFLDSLFKQSHVFIRAYANGKRSIDGIPSVLAGMPSLSETPYISSMYSSNKMDALGTLLKEKGYSTSFFHGGHNGTMGFDYFAKIAGFDKYYGLNEFKGNKEDFDGNWGVFDEPFLKFSVDQINEFNKPFVAGIFTLSSHHPFLLPKNYNYKGPEKVKHPILKTITYTDDALKSFFNYASKQDWYNNTLFVITADHTGPDLSKKAGTMAGIYQIPIAYYMPGKVTPKMDTRVTQQIDIMPTVLDYLGYNQPFYAIGNSIRDTATKGFAINYCLSTHQYFTDSLLYHFYNEESLRLLKPYTDTMLIQNWNIDYKGITKEYELKTKAIIQTYHNDLINNKTHVNR